MEALFRIEDANEKVFDVVLRGDEITWQQILFDLVKSQEMDPWAVDLARLTQQFLTVLRQMQETNLRVNGKIVLATAIMLKLKTSALLDRDINALDTLLASQDDQELPDMLDEETRGRERIKVDGVPKVYPRTPQPRERAVSIFDLVEALEQALEVNVRRQRRILFSHPVVTVPEKKIDLLGTMNILHQKVSEHYEQQERTLTFQELIRGQDRKGIVYAFLPLLHLTTARKTDIEQPEAFNTIYITLAQQGLEAAPGVETGSMTGAEN